MATEDYTDVLSGATITPTSDGVNVFSSAVTVTLTNPVKKIQEATFTAPGRQLRMPDARFLSLGGAPLVVRNMGTEDFELADNSGGAITTIAQGMTYYVYVVDNDTVDGTWHYVQFGIGSGSSLADALAGYGLLANGSKLDVDTVTLAGEGLTASASNPFDVNVDGATIVINGSNELEVGVIDGGTDIADGTITADKLAAGISLVQVFTGSQSGMTLGGTLSVATPGVPYTSDRFNRMVQVLEEQPGSGAQTNTTLDFDLADRNNFDVDSSNPAATITPTSNGSTTINYSNPLIDYTPVTPQFGPNLEFAGNAAQNQINYVLPLNISSGTSISAQTRTLNYPGPTCLYPVLGSGSLVETTPTTPGIYTGIANDTYFSYAKLSTNKFIRVVSNSTATELKFESFSLDSAGNYTAIGSVIVAIAVNGSNYFICPIDSGRALVVYRDATATTLRARVITVPDASNPTAGSEQTTAVTAFTDPRLAQTDTDKFVVTYSSATVVYAKVMTLSGGTLTFGAEATLDTAPTSALNYNVAALGTTSFVAVALSFNAVGPVRAAREITATFSGTTITVQATNTLGDSVAGSQSGNVCRLSTTRALVFYYAAAAGGPTFAVRDYTTIGTPTTVTSTSGSAVTTRGPSCLGFYSTNSVIGIYYGNSTTNAENRYYDYNAGAGTLTTLSVSRDMGWSVAASTNIWTVSDIGKIIEGNSGYVRITEPFQNATGGTALSSAGTPANAFDDNAATTCASGVNGWVGYDFGAAQTVRMVGIRVNITGLYTLSFEAATDAAFTAPVVTQTFTGILNASQIYWFDIGTPTALRYYRTRETAGATFTVQDLYFNFGVVVQAQTAYVDFASGAVITQGNWSLEKPAFTNLNLATGCEANNGAELLITSDTSQVDSSSWEDIDSLSTLTATSRVKRNTASYVIGRGNPASLTSLYNLIAGQPLAATSSTIFRCSVATLSTNRFIVFYQDDGDSNRAKAYLVGLSGTTLTVLSTLTIDSASSSNTLVLPINSTQAILSWTSGAIGHAAIVSNVSDSLAVSSTYNITSVAPGNVSAAVIDANHVLYCASIDNTGKIQARVLDISGTVITAGAITDVVTTTTAEVTCDRVDTAKAVITYGNATSNNFNAVVATINTAADTLSLGSPASIDGANNPASDALFSDALTTNQVLISYGYSGSATTTRFRVLTVSGTTVTVGAENTYASVSNIMAVRTVNSSVVLGSDSNAAIPSLYMVKINGDVVTVSGKAIAPDNMALVTTPNALRFNLAVDGENVFLTGYPSLGYSRGEVFKWGDFSPVYAFSFDGRSEWRVWDYGTGAYRSIASNLASVTGGVNGTWYYKNAADAWVAATPNSQRGALTQAFAIQKNRIPGLTYTTLTDTNWNSFGWTKSGDSTINLAINFDAVSSEVDQLTFTYTSRSEWLVQPPSEYKVNLESETNVVVTKLGAGPDNIEVTVLYPT